MLIYRVCCKSEAESQRVGHPYQVATAKVLSSAHPGLHGTLISEHWRRILNHHAKAAGVGTRYTHTLLLEIPDNLEVEHSIAGLEYRIADLSSVIVRNIAGPAWPVPAWVPQPRNEIDWDPTSTAWSTKVCKWTAK